MIYLTGGPPHQDMVDLKPNAPAEIREFNLFRPASVFKSGIDASPAAMMDKFVAIRSLVGSDGRHSSFDVPPVSHSAINPKVVGPRLDP